MNTKPIRIQRKRTKGWKMPENTVYVGRPSFWGNPFIVGRDGDLETCLKKYREWITGLLEYDAKRKLKGKNLACFCALDQPCHADILLSICNE